LREIDVLIFVGVDPIELSGPAGAIVGVMVEGEGRPEEKIAEVGGVRFLQPA
jgi:hypothetical protein